MLAYLQFTNGAIGIVGNQKKSKEPPSQRTKTATNQRNKLRQKRTTKA